MSTLIPTLDHIVIRLEAPETVLASGIIIADSAQTSSDRGTVVAVGPGAFVDDVLVKPSVNEGDKVLITQGSGFEVEVDKQGYLIVKETNISAIIPETISSASDLKVLNANIIFRFLDEIGGEKRAFTDRKSAGGIIMSSIQGEQRDPRWGEVIAAGPEADVVPGEFIFVEGSMWTRGTKIAGEPIWKTESKFIIAVTTDPAETI